MYMERFTAFALNLANIERDLHKIKSKKMAEYGLRATHLMCMVQIFSHEDGLTPTELARTCAIDKAFVSRITADLVDRKFVMFNEKYNDGRKYRQKFVLTEEGVELIEIAPGVDLEKDVLGQMGFTPIMKDVKLMDARLFNEEKMGLKL